MKNIMNFLRINMKKKLFLFVMISVLIALVTLLLSSFITPWIYSINARVRLYLDAPAETQISLCWDKDQTQCLPFVPYSEARNNVAEPGEIAGLWMSELPPRPVYNISLLFKSDIRQFTFHNLNLDSSSILLFGYARGAGINNVSFNLDQFELDGNTNQTSNVLNNEVSGTTSVLTLNQEVVNGLSNKSVNWARIMLIWGLLFSIYLLVAIPIFLLPNAVLNLGSAVKLIPLPKYPWWIYLIFSGIIVSMVFLVTNSGVIFNQYDPLGYLYLALGGGWFSDARLPGYPLFIGIILRLFQYDLNTVILFQAGILASSAVICVWSLRKWIPPYIAVLFVVLCAFSPAQIHWARWILRESLFASTTLLGITAAIAHFTSRKPLSYIWLIIFSAICGVAFLVRENGMLLPVVLLPVLLPAIIKRFFQEGTFWSRVRSIFAFVIPYTCPIIVLGIIYVGFSSYNFLHYGYFQVGIHQTSHSFTVKSIYPGNSDARGLLNPGPSIKKDAETYFGWPLYSSYILVRDQAPGLDPVYATLYPSVSQTMTDMGQPNNSFHIANILNEIGKNMNSLVPKKAALAGILRQYAMIISSNYSNLYALQVVDPSTLDIRQEIVDRYPLKSRIILEEKVIGSDSFLAQFYKITQTYGWYGIIFILSLISGIYVLIFHDPVFLAPLAMFIANVIMLLISRLVSYRYLVSLDVLLILQMALGIGLWLHRKFYNKPILR
jgi:hypothetical protein